jgi:hypothetical protein
LRAPNAEGYSETERELELKLILSSNVRGWNISENFISTKLLTEPEPWEFGYAFGVSRPLALTAGGKDCFFCRENFSAGAEIYGGLGDMDSFGLNQTSHYAGPAVLSGFRAERKQRGCALPHQGVLRVAADLWTLSSEGKLNRRCLPGWILFAASVCIASDTGWMKHISDTDRGRKNPYVSQADAIAGDRDYLRTTAPSVTARMLWAAGRGPACALARCIGLRRRNLLVAQERISEQGMPSWSSLPEPSHWQIITYVKSLGEQPDKLPPGR